MVRKGYNDLATINPELAKEWHPTKNGNLKPCDVAVNSNEKVWWYLPYDDPQTGKHFDFEWKTSVSNRTTNKTECPYLTNQAVWRGYNDLETLYPEIAKEWHPTKNEKNPYEVSKHSEKKVWWYLPYDDPRTGKHFDFEWKTSVSNRTRNKSGCPYLSSHALWRGYNDLETLYPEIAKEWHPTKNRKLKPCDIMPNHTRKIWWYLPYDDPRTGRHFDFEWNATPNSRTNNKSGCPYLSGQALWRGYNDLETLYPEIAKEWHPTKNGNLKACDVIAKSNKRVWWYLPYDDPRTGKHFDFEWQATVYNRSSQKNRCPYLVNQAVWRGYNDLETLYPELVKEWHPTKNRKQSSDVIATSNKKAWWLCSKNHEWRTEIVLRTIYGRGCPYCNKT